MTAPIVYHLDHGETVDPETLERAANGPQFAERSWPYFRRLTPGQLWERVAELDAATPLRHSNPRSVWDPAVRARYGRAVTS